MDARELYDTDFVLWTEQQAAALRRMAPASNALDIENLAEEVESLGKRDVREVEGLLRQIFLHALKLLLDPQSRDAGHWRAEMLTVQDDARRAFSPSMRRKIDLQDVWSHAIKLFVARHAPGQVAADALGLARSQPAPASLDALIDRNFEPGDLVSRLATVLPVAAEDGDRQ